MVGFTKNMPEKHPKTRQAMRSQIDRTQRAGSCNEPRLLPVSARWGGAGADLRHHYLVGYGEANKRCALPTSMLKSCEKVIMSILTLPQSWFVFVNIARTQV